MMLFIRSLIFNVWVFVWMAVIGILCLPIGMWSRDGAYWVTKLYAKHVIWMQRVLLGITFEVRGTPPTDDVLIVSKHQSFIDMILLHVTVPRTKYVMKSELLWSPFLGWYAMRMGTVAVKRGKKGAAVSAMTAAIAKQAHHPGQVSIFPQGTRIQPGVDAPYKIGAWRIYKAFDFTCHPVALNTGLFWGKRSFLRPPGNMVLEFLEPIEPGLEAQPFMNLIEERIETACAAIYAENAARGEGIKWQPRNG